VRDIDEIIAAVNRHPYISPIHKRVLVNRIEPNPTHEEIERARRELAEEGK
jgi:hypothetical protein